MKEIQIVTITKKLLKEIIKNDIISRSIGVAVVATVCSLFFNACQKESSALIVAHVAASSKANAVSSIPYVSCGMKINVFTPSEYASKVYSFAYTINGQLKKFSIGNSGQLSFTTYDKFSFEFAGYTDMSNTVRFWRIRRTDGKYLTTGLEYKAKMTGPSAAQQTFLLASLGNGQYKIVLPKLPECNLAAIWYDIDLGYRIANFAYDDTYLNDKDTKISMIVIPLSNY